MLPDGKAPDAQSRFSGGQSRALMIADVIYLSASPVVLIDEIENAGIDRVKAVYPLLNKEKIVLIAIHDPLLALSCDRRIVIKNGGIADVVKTLEVEKKMLPAWRIWTENRSFCGKGFARENTWLLTKIISLTIFDFIFKLTFCAETIRYLGFDMVGRIKYVKY